MSKGYVYTLNDPETGEPVYVGATIDPNKRLKAHTDSPHSEKLKEWVDSLEKKPEMTLIRVAPVDELSQAETDAIESLSEEWELFNYDRVSGYGTKDGETNSTAVKIPDPLYERAKEESDRRDITIGAVVDEWHRKSIQWDERNQICPDDTLELDKLKRECGDE